MARIIGVRDLHIVPLVKDDTVGQNPTYETINIKKLESIISIDIADQTENVTFYSNDTVEQIIPAFSGKEVTIELGYLPQDIEALLSGNKFENGVFTQSSDAEAPNVAMMFRAPKSKCNNDIGVDADLTAGGAFRYVVLFKGVLSRTEENYQGKQDTIESSNVTLTGLFMPLTYNGEVELRTDNDVIFGTTDEVTNGLADVDEQYKQQYKDMIRDWFTDVQFGEFI